MLWVQILWISNLKENNGTWRYFWSVDSLIGEFLSYIFHLLPLIYPNLYLCCLRIRSQRSVDTGSFICFLLRWPFPTWSWASSCRASWCSACTSGCGRGDGAARKTSKSTRPTSWPSFSTQVCAGPGRVLNLPHPSTREEFANFSCKIYNFCLPQICWPFQHENTTTTVCNQKKMWTYLCLSSLNQNRITMGGGGRISLQKLQGASFIFVSPSSLFKVATRVLALPIQKWISPKLINDQPYV